MMNYPFAILVIVYVGSFSYLYLRCRDRLPFHKYLSNHVLLYASLNFLFTYFTIGRPGAVFETKSVPGLDKIKENYQDPSNVLRMLSIMDWLPNLQAQMTKANCRGPPGPTSRFTKFGLL